MTMRKISLILLITLASLMLSACGGQTHEQPAQPGTVLIKDDAGLFTEEDTIKIEEAMEELSQYGHVAVVTLPQYETIGGVMIDRSMSTAAMKATEYYNSLFGTESGFLFMIDMAFRDVYVETDGYIGDFVTRAKALTITDNVYQYTESGKYGVCAVEAIRQAVSLVEGKRISQPMRIVSGAFVAVLAALMINFAVLRRLNRKPEVPISEISLGVRSVTKITNERVNVESRKFQTAAVDKANIAITILRILLIILTSGGGGGSGKSGGGGHSSHGGGHRF